ncbi:MAG: pyruvate kinase [Elusimicrobia bacterium]|nr:pyruvate kinase [Elusimicrobiota bacterium]
MTKRRPVDLKRTKILATLGPVSAKPEVLHSLFQAGVDAVRLNCSHSSVAELQGRIALVRSAARRARRSCAVVMDLQGPRLRVGRLRNGEPVELQKGARVRLTTRDIPGTAQEIPTNFRRLPQAVRKGLEIRLDDGALVLSVVKTGSDWVDAEVLVGGSLKEHKGINLPGADIDLPALTPKDLKDLEQGLRLGIDHVALSFVRSAKDVRRARGLIRRAGAKIGLIAKIEHPLALDRIDAILEASDGIMIARGDLAVELSAAQVPAIQKTLVRKANTSGKLSIVATQMLESMISRAQPTRAEASDVANAIYDGADVVMLSGESAVGLYPVETVAVMTDIIRQAEASPFRYKLIPQGLMDTPDTGFAHALARACHDACEVTGAKLVIVYTMTGWSARVMAKYRPRAPIVAMTPLKATYQRLSLDWGVTPMLCPLGKSTDEMLSYGERILLKNGLVKAGEITLITAGGTARHKASNMLKVHVIGSLTYR